MNEYRAIGWAFAASLACHCLFLLLMLEFAPWKILKSGRSGPLIIELSTMTPRNAVEGAETPRPARKERPEQPEKRQKSEKKLSEQSRLNIASPAGEIERAVKKEQPQIDSLSLKSDTSSPRADIGSLSPRFASPGAWHKEYSATLREEIEKQQRYPIMAMRGRQEGTVEVAFLLERSGRLLACHISRSCRHSILDRAALAAVKEVGRFPPFPDEINLDQATFVIPISFQMER